MNINLEEPEGDQREEDIAEILVKEGMDDMAAHFLLQRRRWCRDMRTWRTIQKEREVQSRTYYILGMDRRLFRNISAWDPRHNSDHYMVLSCLPNASLTEHKRYLGPQKKLPLKPLTEPTREDEVFAALRRAVPKASVREAKKNEWISTETWRPVDERVSARPDPAKGKAKKKGWGAPSRRAWRRIGDGA